MSDEAEASSSNPPVYLSRQLCLSFVFLSVLCGSKISSCHSVQMCHANKSMVSSICGRAMCVVWYFDSHLQYLPGQKVDDDPKKKTKKRPWRRSSCRKSNSARLVRNVSKIQKWCTSTCLHYRLMWIHWGEYVCVLGRSSLVWGS